MLCSHPFVPFSLRPLSQAALWEARQAAVAAREMELRVMAGRGQWPGAHRSSLMRRSVLVRAALVPA